MSIENTVTARNAPIHIPKRSLKKSIIMSLIIYRKAYTPYKEKNKKYIRRNLEKRNVCKKQIYNVDSSEKR